MLGLGGFKTDIQGLRKGMLGLGALKGIQGLQKGMLGLGALTLIRSV